jgi:hypothetical protein
MPSLQEYLLIDSETISVERDYRGEGRMWLYYPYTEGYMITLPSIEFEFAMPAVFASLRISHTACCANLYPGNSTDRNLTKFFKVTGRWQIKPEIICLCV